MKILFVLLLSSVAFADQVVHPREPIGGGSAMDLLNQKPENVEKLKPKSDEGGIRITSTCQQANGRVLNADDAGYENCVQTSKNKKEASPSLGLTTAKPQK